MECSLETLFRTSLERIWMQRDHAQTYKKYQHRNSIMIWIIPYTIRIQSLAKSNQPKNLFIKHKSLTVKTILAHNLKAHIVFFIKAKSLKLKTNLSQIRKNNNDLTSSQNFTNRQDMSLRISMVRSNSRNIYSLIRFQISWLGRSIGKSKKLHQTLSYLTRKHRLKYRQVL
jgi:hypothetical protein